MMGKQEAGQKGIIPQVSGLITKQMPGSVCEIILHPSLIFLSSMPCRLPQDSNRIEVQVK